MPEDLSFLLDFAFRQILKLFNLWRGLFVFILFFSLEFHFCSEIFSLLSRHLDYWSTLSDLVLWGFIHFWL
jgi:hypothetical protein